MVKYLSKKYPYELNIDEINMMLDNGLIQIDIGKHYGCSNKIINKFIKKIRLKNKYVKI